MGWFFSFFEKRLTKGEISFTKVEYVFIKSEGVFTKNESNLTKSEEKFISFGFAVTTFEYSFTTIERLFTLYVSFVSVSGSLFTANDLKNKSYENQSIRIDNGLILDNCTSKSSEGNS